MLGKRKNSISKKPDPHCNTQVSRFQQLKNYKKKEKCVAYPKEKLIDKNCP